MKKNNTKKDKVIKLKTTSIVNLKKTDFNISFKDIDINKLKVKDLKILKTIEKLKEHKAVLKSVGLEDFNTLGSTKLRGKISPSIGVFHPKLLVSQNKKTNSKQKIGIEKLKIRNVNAKIFNPKTNKYRKFRNGSEFNVLPSVLSNSNTRATRNIFPIGRSYIASGNLILDSYSSIVINSEITDLIIIANSITTSSSNINITWNPETLPSAENHSDPTDVDMGVNGKHGIEGNHGSDGRFAPNIEIWTLNPIRDNNNNIVLEPLTVTLNGQKGTKGGKGQNGGNGGRGEKGRDGDGNFYNCKRGPKSGKPGGQGGNAGSGGRGGDGSDGGRLEIYTINPSGFWNTVLQNEGGKGGLGGAPGAPGSGGLGGSRGFAPKMCANTDWVKHGRQDGRRGTRGARGSSGAKGDNGLDGGGLFTSPISATVFNQILNNPGIVNISSVTVKVTENIQIYGVNFNSTDRVLIDNTNLSTVFNNTSPSQIHTIKIPDVVGGWKDVQIMNTASNYSNRVRLYILPTIQSLSHSRIKPNEKLTIRGYGFSSQCKVSINNQEMPFTDFIDKNTLEIEVIRPNAIDLNAGGEKVVVKILDNHNHESNTVNLTLDTYRIFVCGDSVMTQAYENWNTFPGQISSYLKSINPGIGMYTDYLCHSGATLIEHPDRDSHEGDWDWDKEIPRSLPTITSQVESFISNDSVLNDNVELILMNGSFNDLSMFTLLEPYDHQKNMDKIEIQSEKYAFVEMRKLLRIIATNFPNTKVVITGYYQVVSKDSKSMENIMKFIGFQNAGLVGLILTKKAFDNIATQCKYASSELNRHMQRAVNEVNLEFATTNFNFVDPEFEEKNAIFATDSFLWEFNLAAQVDDPLKLRRKDICDGKIICNIASVGHPNDQGKLRYYNKVKEVL